MADCLKDAVNVILNQIKDLQLAIAVTRVYEGEGGPVLKELLQDKVLPLAAQEGNRWLASWAFWMLHRRDMSVRALIVSYFYLLHWLQTDFCSHQSIPYSKRHNHPTFRQSFFFDRRPGTSGSILPATTNDVANPSRGIKGHT